MLRVKRFEVSDTRLFGPSKMSYARERTDDTRVRFGAKLRAEFTS